ncbi:hypothetical protein D9M71_651300 [compost metagenome]
MNSPRYFRYWRRALPSVGSWISPRQIRAKLPRGRPWESKPKNSSSSSLTMASQNRLTAVAGRRPSGNSNARGAMPASSSIARLRSGASSSLCSAARTRYAATESCSRMLALDVPRCSGGKSAHDS